jgi:hypothetical protein
MARPLAAAGTSSLVESLSSLPTLAVPTRGAYTGSYAEFGDSEEEVTRDKIEAFASLVDKHQALVGFSNHWGTGHFPTEQVRIVDAYGAVPLIYWNPWERRNDATGGRFTLESIESGTWDGYIDDWARAAREYGKPLLVAWGYEMNGNWFPWCGVFHGGGEPDPAAGPHRHRGPDLYRRVYRHVVDRVRAAGASNISWVFQTNNTPDPAEPWNIMAAYYPGSNYVDWLAMSAYGKQYPGEDWTTVREAFHRPYAELAALDPKQPILMAEWGIAEFPDQGSKAEWIAEALGRMEHEMPRLKGAIFWHDFWRNGDRGDSNLRVDSSPGALRAYREGIARGFWLAEPEVRTRPGSADAQAPPLTRVR